MMCKYAYRVLPGAKCNPESNTTVHAAGICAFIDNALGEAVRIQIENEPVNIMLLPIESNPTTYTHPTTPSAK